jgi:hypothetical protein
MRYSRYGKRRTFIKTTGVNLTELNQFDLGGLNTYLPDELMKDNETPYARNFRIYESDTEEARVCISKRKGHTFYSVPIGETNRGEITSTTDAAEKDIANITQYAQPFTVSASGRLTKIEIKVDNGDGTAPLRVDIYSDVDSAPGTLLASSSISNSAMPTSSAYTTVRFIEAPQVATSTTYWIVVYRQVEGTGTYTISSNTSATTAKISTDGGNTWAETTYCLNYKVYVSTDAPIKAIYRYYRSDAVPQTLIVAGGTLYSVNDSTGATTVIDSSLDATATDYHFVTILDIVYFVNGKDVPKKLTDSTLTDVAGLTGLLSGAATDIAFHKQRLWFLLADSKVIYSEDLDFATYDSLNYIYAPSPNAADPAIRIMPFQDNLVVFTRTGKYVIYGSDTSTIVIRESTGVKGLTSPSGLWKESSNLYFISDDDVYAYNGGTDVGLGIKVDRILKDTATNSNIDLVIHGGKLRLYYTPSGYSHNKNCLIYDLAYKKWMLDEDIYIGTVAVFDAQTDESVLVHGSSLVGAIYYAEVGDNDLGKPIKFEYRTKYFSYDHPSRKNRVKRLYVFFRPGQANYYVDVQIAVDDVSSPTSNLVYLGTSGAVWGSFAWGDGSTWGGGTLAPKRLSIPGQAKQHQIRFVQNGADNPVELLGITQYIQVRKPL